MPRLVPREYVRRDDVGKFSLTKFLEGQLEGDDSSFEARISARLRRDAPGRPPLGGYAPFAVLARRDLTAGVGESGGYLVGSDVAGELLVPALRPTILQTLGIAEIRVTGGDVVLPRVASGAEAAFVPEGSPVGVLEPVFGQVTATAKRCVAKVRCSRALRRQIDVVVADRVLVDDLRAAVEAAVTRAVLAGSGTMGEPLGLINHSSVPSVSGSGLNIGGAAAAVAAVAAQHTPLDRVAWVVSPDVWQTLAARTATGSGRFVIEENRLCGFPVHVSQAMPAGAALFGDFSDVLLLTWGPGIDIVATPYGGDGNIVVFASVYVDVVIRRPGSFVKIVDVS